MSVLRVLQRAPTPERPGPGEMPDALLRALDITIGPYETYNDEMFGYKAAFEAYVTIRDERLTDRLHHWAKAEPNRIFMAERGKGGAWRQVTYAQLLGFIRHIASALLGRGLSADRPIVILSGLTTSTLLNMIVVPALYFQHAKPSASLPAQS